MFLYFIIPYRANKEQEFRKQELQDLLINIDNVQKKNNHLTIISYIIEQNNSSKKFNRGKLLNIGFLEYIKLNKEFRESIIIHCNTDYRIPEESLPEVFNSVPDSIIDIHGYPEDTLGGFVLFSHQNYVKCNGFPNDFYGWGGEDWAIWKRIKLMNINIIRPPELYNKWIIENKGQYNVDISDNIRNIGLASETNITNTISNGINNCSYILDDITIINNNYFFKVSF